VVASIYIYIYIGLFVKLGLNLMQLEVKEHKVSFVPVNSRSNVIFKCHKKKLKSESFGPSLDRKRFDQRRSPYFKILSS
jgi:hypothetical protein